MFLLANTQHEQRLHLLLQEIQRWREANSGSSLLNTSDYERVYPASVFKHYQYDGPAPQYSSEFKSKSKRAVPKTFLSDLRLLPRAKPQSALKVGL